MWKLPPPSSDYYAVIFSSTKSNDLEGYEAMDEQMMELAQQQQGFLGYESSSNNGQGIFISYWQDMESIKAWRANVSHQLAKSHATKWYKRYLSQICKVESSHLFEEK